MKEEEKRKLWSLCFYRSQAWVKHSMHRFLHSLVYFAESMSLCPDILLKTILKETVFVLFLRTHLCIFLQYTHHIVSINRSLAFSILRVREVVKKKGLFTVRLTVRVYPPPLTVRVLWFFQNKLTYFDLFYLFIMGKNGPKFTFSYGQGRGGWSPPPLYGQGVVIFSK